MKKREKWGLTLLTNTERRYESYNKFIQLYIVQEVLNPASGDLPEEFASKNTSTHLHVFLNELLQVCFTGVGYKRCRKMDQN